MKILILDLKGPVSTQHLQSLLKEIQPDFCYAVTPSAMYQFNKLGWHYRTIGSEIDFEAFSKRGRDCYDDLLRLLKENYGTDYQPYLAYLGYDLKIFIDYLRQEDLKLKWLKKKCQIACVHAVIDYKYDIENINMSDIADNDFTMHRASLYIPLLSSLVQVHRLPYESVRGFQKKKLFSYCRSIRYTMTMRYVIATLLHKTWLPFNDLRSSFNLLNGKNKKSCLMKSEYDAKYLIKDIEKRMRIIDGRLANSFHGDQYIERKEENHHRYSSFYENLTEGYLDDLSPEISNFARASLKKIIYEAEDFVRFWKRNIERFRDKYNIKLVLCSGFERTFNSVASILKDKVKSFVIPHGPLFQNDDALDLAEGYVANTVLAPSKYHKTFQRKDITLVTTGSINMSKISIMRRKNRKESILYILFPHKGNCDYISGGKEVVKEFDGYSLFNRHIGVIDLFDHFKHDLVIRPHPYAFSNLVLYEPLMEYVEDLGAEKIQFDLTRFPPDVYLDGFDCVIFDYACTGLVQALFKRTPRILCHLGHPVAICEDDVKKALIKTVDCVVTDKDFLEKIQGELSGNRKISTVNEAERIQFLNNYGALDIPVSKAKNVLLQTVLDHTAQERFNS